MSGQMLDTSVLVNLKILAKLKKGQKLSTRNHFFVIDNSSIFSMTGVVRWVTGESRMQTIRSIDYLVTACTQVDDPTGIVMHLITDASFGLRNLILTYSDDDTAVAGLEIILDKISRFVSSDTIEEEVEGDSSI